MIKLNAIIRDLKANLITLVELGGEEIHDVTTIAGALKENHSLTNLELGDNSISDIGAGAIAEALKENRSLINLELGDNNIGHVGVGAIAEALKENHSLTNLELGRNYNISDAVLFKINELITRNITGIENAIYASTGTNGIIGQSSSLDDTDLEV